MDTPKVISQVAMERFWSHVDKKGPDDCWEWKASKNPSGYGKFHIDKIPRAAHRVAYSLYYGQAIERNILVCHACDNPSCVNPLHLWLGTPQDNMDDAVRKGRIHRWNGKRAGANNPCARLSEQQVIEIMSLHKKGESVKRIATKYAVSKNTIRNIFWGISWKHISQSKGHKGNG